jgi:predicted nucleic acid-binding protein
MIVADTNILAYLYFPSDLSSEVQKLENKNEEWIVPSSWRSEFINVATAYYRKGIITIEQATESVKEAVRSFEDYELDADIETIMLFVKKSQCSSYDCQFVALAHQLNIRLLTYDRQILIEFPDIAIKPSDYLVQNF